MTATFESLMHIDTQLAAKGEYPLPEFWVEQAKRLYGHPTANTLVARCGRGSVKSGFGSRVALNEVIAGDFEVPASEVHYWVDLSENKAEAEQRLRQYETWLGLLGLPFKRNGDKIELPSLRRGFFVRAFQVGKVSGFRAIGFRSDELAKCDDDEEAADPAHKVIASARAMTVTHIRRRPKNLLLASPVGVQDHHAQCFELGDTDEQVICSGATWVCNPSITEAETHALEPDPDTWQREYAAIPSESETTAFIRSDVALCYRNEERTYFFGRPFMALDPASTGNTFSWLIGAWGEPDKSRRQKPMFGPPGSGCEMLTIGTARDEHGIPVEMPIAERPLLWVTRVGGWTGEELRQTTMDRVASELWGIASRAGAQSIFSDEHGGVFLAALVDVASQARARFRHFKQTQTSKHEAVTYLRTLMRDRQILIAPHERMRRDLETYPRRIVGGGFKYGAARAGHHWDYASALVIMAHAFTQAAETPEHAGHQIDQNPAQRFGGGRRTLIR